MSKHNISAVADAIQLFSRESQHGRVCAVCVVWSEYTSVRRLVSFSE